MSTLEMPKKSTGQDEPQNENQPFLGKFLKGRFGFSPSTIVALAALNTLLVYEFVKSVSCGSGLFGCGWGGFGVIFPLYVAAMLMVGKITLWLYVALFLFASVLYNYSIYTLGVWAEQKFAAKTLPLKRFRGRLYWQNRRLLQFRNF